MANELTNSSQSSVRNLLASNSASDINHALSGQCDRAKLLQDIRDLMGMYWIPADTPEERTRHCAIFVKDLARFSQAVVDRAIWEWRTEETRRPSSAALVQKCQRFEHLLLERLDRLTPMPAPVEAPREVKSSAEKIEAVAKAFRRAGFESDREGQWSLPETKDEKPRVPHWSETDAANNPRFIESLRRAREGNALMAEAGA